MTIHQLDKRLFNWASILDDETREQARTASTCLLYTSDAADE